LGQEKQPLPALCPAGAKVFDADKIVHRLLLPGGACFGPIVRYFGKKVLTDGKIDHKKIAQIVFTHPDKLKNFAVLFILKLSRKCAGRSGSTGAIKILRPLYRCSASYRSWTRKMGGCAHRSQGEP